MLMIYLPSITLKLEKKISDIYPTELQLNKANSCDKETPSLDLHIQVVDNDTFTSVYDKRDAIGCSIFNFPRLNGDFPRLPSSGIYISQTIFAR